MLWFWLAVAVGAAIGEVLTYGLFLAPVAFAAIITAILSVVFPVAAVEIGVFAAVSLTGIAFVRPAIKHALGIDSLAHLPDRAGHHNLIGRRGVVTRTVDGSGGQIRIGEGEFWTARTLDPEETLAPGQLVEVALVEGVTALVEPISKPALEATGSATDQKGT